MGRQNFAWRSLAQGRGGRSSNLGRREKGADTKGENRGTARGRSNGTREARRVLEWTLPVLEETQFGHFFHS